jgi:protein-tyrosine phosphatase
VPIHKWPSYPISGLFEMWRLIKKRTPKSLKRALKHAIRNVLDSAQFRFSGEVPEARAVAHVIFVCKGNICRSAFAEHYFRSKAVHSLKIESCGLDVDQGFFPPEESVLAAAQLGIDLGAHHSKGIAACDIKNADLILAMEVDQYRRLVAEFPEKKERIGLLRNYVTGPSGLLCNIEDPYGQPLQNFKACYRLIQKALDKLAAQTFQERKGSTKKVK